MHAHIQDSRYAIYHPVGNGKSNSIAIRLSQGNVSIADSPSKLTDKPHGKSLRSLST